MIAGDLDYRLCASAGGNCAGGIVASFNLANAMPFAEITDKIRTIWATSEPRLARNRVLDFDPMECPHCGGPIQAGRRRPVATICCRRFFEGTRGGHPHAQV